MNDTARQIIAALGLEPLPGEGGFFRPTWRSRTASAIYFLITEQDFSALHRLAQDEVWHFYAGDTVEHAQIDPRSGALRVTRLGGNVLAGESPQVIVPADTWQGARLAGRAEDPPHSGYALLGCTVSPPWDERGFALAARAELLRLFPPHASWIHALTR